MRSCAYWRVLEGTAGVPGKVLTCKADPSGDAREPDVTDKFRLLGCSVSRNVAKMKLPIVWPVSRKRARA